VLALDDEFYFFDFGSGKLDLIVLVDADQSRTRLNDGKYDRRGRRRGSSRSRWSK